MSWSRVRFVGAVFLVFIVVGAVGAYGWIKYGPENNVRMWLDTPTIERGDEMNLYIRNLGSESILFGYSYEIFRVYENGTTRRHQFSENWAWPAGLHVLLPFGTHSEKIYMDLEPGEYYMLKEYRIGKVYYEKKLYFTVQ